MNKPLPNQDLSKLRLITTPKKNTKPQLPTDKKSYAPSSWLVENCPSTY
jgi:hypothetical protein